ncbi:MAG: YraN family protein [Acidobacteria bacterium]|nr:MAG: YraN family protein [Acidobacteriota bacterium]
MSDVRQRLGRIGEDLACGELERRGYAILARRYRRRAGELDIVARDGRTVVFVEVKTREGLEFGAGVEAVTSMKRRRMMRVAQDFVVRHHLGDCPCRFDVVSIDMGAGCREPAIEVFQNAFINE